MVAWSARSWPDDAPADTLNLAEALEACEGMGVNVEVKNLPGEPDHDASDLVCEAVAGLVGAYRPIDELLVSSFDISAVDRIRQPNPRCPPDGWWWTRLGTDMILDRVGGPRARDVCLWDEALVDESMVVSAHQRGLRMWSGRSTSPIGSPNWPTGRWTASSPTDPGGPFGARRAPRRLGADC